MPEYMLSALQTVSPSFDSMQRQLSTTSNRFFDADTKGKIANFSFFKTNLHQNSVPTGMFTVATWIRHKRFKVNTNGK